MSRRALLLSLVAVAVCAGVTAGLYAKAASASTPGVIALAGDVRVDEYTVRAPSVVAPTPDYTVGIPTTATASAPRKGAPASAGGSSRLPVVSGFLSDVLVAEGAHVKRGEVIARLDTTMLDLGVAQATTARTRARANVDVIDANLDKLATARTKLLKARASLTKARAGLVKARASLETTIALLKKQRSSLEATITAIQALIGQPGGPPPHVPPYPVLLQGLQQALAGLDKGLVGAQTGLTTMTKGLATMDKGFATMAKGLSQLDSAKRQLRDVRALAVINVSAQDIAVRLADDRRAAAAITSPVDGVVTFTRTPGTAVMVGAPLVSIRPDGPLRVTTYMTPDQLAQVHIGSRATVGFDSNTAGALTGHLEVVGDHAVVPPTSFPTAIVHMTRAVLVTIVLDEGQYAPPGTPVDVEIAINPGR